MMGKSFRVSVVAAADYAFLGKKGVVKIEKYETYCQITYLRDIKWWEYITFLFGL